MRVCCDNPSMFEVEYDGGSAGNDTMLICKDCITKHPFNKRILSTEIVQ